MDQKTLKQLERLMQGILTKSLANVVTKDDAKTFLTKEDAKNFATKDDIHSLKRELLSKLKNLDEMQMAIFKTVDKVKEDRGTVKELDKRVIKLEREVFA